MASLAWATEARPAYETPPAQSSEKMTFQIGMHASIAVMLTGGATYYFNEEYPERRTMTRLGLAITLLGFALLLGAMLFLRQGPK